MLTLDRRDFRAMLPLTPHKCFRLLPDDLEPTFLRSDKTIRDLCMHWYCTEPRKWV
jgi:hypothetical protein